MSRPCVLEVLVVAVPEVSTGAVAPVAPGHPLAGAGMMSPSPAL